MFAGLLLLLFVGRVFSVEPTGMREWTADVGTKLMASAIEVSGDVVVFKSSDGTRIEVPLARLVEADQQLLGRHFNSPGSEAEVEGQIARNETEADSGDHADVSGAFRENIKAGELAGAQAYVSAYVPASVEADARMPAFCYVDRRKSKSSKLKKFQAGSEVTGWPVVMHSEMSGSIMEKFFKPVADGWKDAMRKELPIDVERLYCLSYASSIESLNEIGELMGGFDGILTVSGTFDDEGSKLDVCYGMIGLNSASRIKFTKYFEKKAGKDSLIRYTANGGADASADEYEDGMIYLAIHYYRNDGARRSDQLPGFIDRLHRRMDEISTSDPERAYMWLMQSEKLVMNKVQKARWLELKAKLEKLETCVAYFKGFDLFKNLGFKEIGEAESSVDEKANEKIERELARMKDELEGTKWIPVIESFEG